jgi:hypothetical protein
LGVFLLALIAMYGTFGSWRRGLESLGADPAHSFVVAIVIDALLIVIVLANEAAWSALTQVRLRVSRGTWIGAIISLFERVGVLYLYGWISLRGGGDWWDLF